MSFVSEFKEFAVKGNALDLAIGVVIGAGFKAIVDSLVNDIIMPPVGFLTNGNDFRDLFIDLSGGDYSSLEQAKAAGAATINYGLFLNTLLQFLIVAFTLFLVVRTMNRLRRKMEKDKAKDAEASA